MITKSKDEDVRDTKESKQTADAKETEKIVDEIPVKEEMKKAKSELTLSTDSSLMNGHSNRVKSPSPRILKDVLAEEVPQYKR